MNRVSFRENPMSFDAQSDTLLWTHCAMVLYVTVDETQFIIKKKEKYQKEIDHCTIWSHAQRNSHNATPNYVFERKIFKILNHFIWLMMFWVCVYVYRHIFCLLPVGLRLAENIFVKRQPATETRSETRAGFLWQM